MGPGPLGEPGGGRTRKPGEHLSIVSIEHKPACDVLLSEFFHSDNSNASDSGTASERMCHTWPRFKTFRRHPSLGSMMKGLPVAQQANLCAVCGVGGGERGAMVWGGCGDG